MLMAHGLYCYGKIRKLYVNVSDFMSKELARKAMHDSVMRVILEVNLANLLLNMIAFPVNSNSKNKNLDTWSEGFF